MLLSNVRSGKSSLCCLNEAGRRYEYLCKCLPERVIGSRSVVRWLDRYGGLLKSKTTEAQPTAVPQRPYFSTRLSPTFRQTVDRILGKAELVAVVERVAVCRDPTDDKFLDLALNGSADLIVTGDKDAPTDDLFDPRSVR